MEWLIGVIILSIISSFFNKKNDGSEKRARQQQGGNKRSNSSFPDLEGALKDLDKRFNDWDMPEVKKEWSQTKELRNPRVSKHEVIRVENPKHLATQQITDVIKDNSIKANEITSANSNVNQEFTAKEAVQGMMWAEIFGKPRSKNPHQSLQKARVNR